MTMAKSHPEKVNLNRVWRAVEIAGGDKQSAWSYYIQLSWRETGNLAPSCDARDFWAAIGHIKTKEK